MIVCDDSGKLVKMTMYSNGIGINGLKTYKILRY